MTHLVPWPLPLERFIRDQDRRILPDGYVRVRAFVCACVCVCIFCARERSTSQERVCVPVACRHRCVPAVAEWRAANSHMPPLRMHTTSTATQFPFYCSSLLAPDVFCCCCLPPAPARPGTLKMLHPRPAAPPGGAARKGPPPTTYHNRLSAKQWRDVLTSPPPPPEDEYVGASRGACQATRTASMLAAIWTPIPKPQLLERCPLPV